MTEVEMNGEPIAEYLWQRELYIGAHIMIRRQGELGEPGPEPTTYLGLAVAAPVAPGHERPFVTGTSGGRGLMLPLPMPAGSPWSGDPVPDELPLGFAVDEVGAALGGAGSEPLHSTGSEVSAPKVSRRREEPGRGE